MTGHRSWRPTRRRLTGALAAALAPVAACSVALGALTTWVSTGNAGSPPRVVVTDGRLWASLGDTPETSAYFRITNLGGADDRLLKVTSGAVTGTPALYGHRMLTDNTATDQEIDSIIAPAGRTVDMSPGTYTVILPADRDLRPGDLVPFTLHFEYEGPVQVQALVQPAGTAPS
ncbi:copper chaperone PCu(A)C [Streptomyces poriticola]|uniref:copper chaperone PCu(A)C n=1 Tax=Streptomyces poriticola TaxID=3120506 RepID=UPI002FCE266E